VETNILRRFVGALFAAGVLGIGIELCFLGHTEDRWQLVPLVLLGLGLMAQIWLVWRPSSASLRAFRSLMLFFVLSGFVGVYLHYSANVEFELEMYPSRRGLELIREALTGALPALAPATMMHLGFLGLASTYRYLKGATQ
jgi:hypothetical protein